MVTKTETNATKLKVYYGVCINWNIERGFGFIKTANPQRTVFVHRTSVAPDDDGFQDLEIGNTVRYVVGIYNNRPQAVDVVRIPHDEYIAAVGVTIAPVVSQGRTDATN